MRQQRCCAVQGLSRLQHVSGRLGERCHAPCAGMLDAYGNMPYDYSRRCLMPSTGTPTARLEARISPELHALLKRAAALQDRTITDFVIAAVQDAAQRAIEQAEVLRLSVADQERFAQALLAPPPAAPALERAFARHRAMVVPE